VTGFHKTIEKGGYASIHRGATFGVIGVLIEKRACLGDTSRDIASHALTPAKIDRAHQPEQGAPHSCCDGGDSAWILPAVHNCGASVPASEADPRQNAQETTRNDEKRRESTGRQ